MSVCAQTVRHAALVAAAVVAGALFYAAFLPSLTAAGDLEIYRAAARVENPYDGAQIVAAMRAEGRVVKWVERWSEKGCSPFFYPPGVWIFMRPLERLDYPAAFGLMASLNAAAFALLALRTPRGVRLDFVFLGLPTLALNVAVGQVNVVLAALADRGLAGVAAVCKPFVLAGSRRRVRDVIVFATLMAVQVLALPELAHVWLVNISCLDRLGATGATGAWQAGIRVLLPFLPAPVREYLWAVGLFVGGPMGLATAAFLTSASWLPYDVFLLPLLRERLKGRASATVYAAWMLTVVGNLPFFPGVVAAVGRLALLTDSAVCGIKRAKAPAGGSPRSGRFLLSTPNLFSGGAQMKWLKRFITDERGDITQNAVFLAIIIILTIAALRLLGGNVRDLFNRIAGYVANP